jgi:hypothetical protein
MAGRTGVRAASATKLAKITCAAGRNAVDRVAVCPVIPAALPSRTPLGRAADWPASPLRTLPPASLVASVGPCVSGHKEGAHVPGPRQASPGQPLATVGQASARRPFVGVRWGEAPPLAPLCGGEGGQGPGSCPPCPRPHTSPMAAAREASARGQGGGTAVALSPGDRRLASGDGDRRRSPGPRTVGRSSTLGRGRDAPRRRTMAITGERT